MRTRESALDLLARRVSSTLAETGERFPYVADGDTGEWTTTANGNWCGGHWVHMLWMAADITGEERFARAARSHTETMHEYMPRESMFCGMNFLHAGFESQDITDEGGLYEIGIEGADAMVQYYHERARQIPVGTLTVEVPDGVTEFRGPANEVTGEVCGATDSIHAAVSILWRAYEETGDPTYRDVAISHADRHLDWYIREDGRTWNIAHFDPETGELIERFNDLGYSDETCWARGQGWTIAGLSDAYRATGAKRYRWALEDVVSYYTEATPEDLVPHWDFEHPDAPNVPRDTSAAAIAAHGLTRLPPESETEALRSTGESIVDSLIENYLTPTEAGDERPAGMVLHGCYNGPAGYAVDNELLWTDYYLMATLYHGR